VNSYKFWTREEAYSAKNDRIKAGIAAKSQHEAKTAAEVDLEHQILDAIFYLNKAKQSLYSIGLTEPDVRKAKTFMRLAKKTL
jgi:hypothetical protein